ncbi:MAG: type II toxin-antitoxin system RelE/ParE family toxin [Phyllobacteriaceae bacterium]|nr:type II toxin-antitoxin system RelE/ParE family toxin [Phyllobacteriaceae bacterium]
MRVVITGASRADLKEIALFISRDNPARALTFVAELTSACQGLAEKPERFGLFPGLEKRGLRRRPFGNYIISLQRPCRPRHGSPYCKRSSGFLPAFQA